MVIAFSTLLFTYVLAIPIGIYSATHQYSFGDFTSTFFGFVGLATPNFMLALVLMYIFFRHFHIDVGGLFSVEYQLAPWSAGKLWDLIKHLPIPVIVIGTAGTAGLIRILRGTLLDELSRQYVITARAKGVHERVLLFKYPVRLALNPIISTVGHLLPAIVSGGTITAVVLGLPTTGPILLEALRQQDMYLAASAVFLLSVLAVIGTLISDLLLVVVDPRIRMEQAAG
jgi:peptide/nickel transport system permease protein